MKRMLLVLLAAVLLGGCGKCIDNVDGGSLNIPVDGTVGLSYVDIDILLVSSGQSNSAGVSNYKFEYEELSNTYFFLDGKWYADYPYTYTGPEASLANEVARQYPNSAIGIVKVAASGTSIYSWRSDWVESDTNVSSNGGHLYDRLINTINDAKETSGKSSIDGFFWMQGESDALTEYLSVQYKTTLIDFIQDIRNDVGYSLLVIGLISPIKSDMYYVQTVREAQSVVANTIADVVTVETNTLDQCCDDLHFNIKSQKLLGEAFGKEFINHIY